MDEQNKSVGWVAIALALAVAYFGWVFLAADYFQNDPTETQRKTSVWLNSVAQLPNFPSVVGHALRNRLWVLVGIAVAEIAVLVIWTVMRKLERELWGEPHRPSPRPRSRA
jgi:hypothetical protein